ncbi:MAG: hypothetical protein KF729_38270 [Sandaracinaceae bacterium]|nr:hypothetical protein [Sandaracinaceae bacterium]
MPTALAPTVRLTAEGPVLQVDRGHGPEVVDLSGNAIRSVTGDTGSALALSWGEEPKPEDQVDEGDGESEPAR